MLQGPVSSALKLLFFPMLFGIVSLMLLNLVDTWYVSKMGTHPLAAMGFIFPVINLVGSSMIGISVGTTSVVSRAIGAGDHDRVRRLVTHALLLGVLVVLALTIAGLATIDPLFTLLGATPETLPLIHEYMSVWYFGVVFLVVPMIGLAAIRASGDARTPAMVMTGAAVINLVLDPIFIFGFGPIPALGLSGAAIATVLARSLTFFVALRILTTKMHMLDLSRPRWSAVLESWRAVLTIGATAAVTNAIVPISIGILTGIIADYGPVAVAAYGAGSRVDAFAQIVPMALSASMGPLIGQNWGARHYDRVAQALQIAIRCSFAWGLFSLLLLALCSGPIAGLFTAEPDVEAILQTYLRIAPLGHGFLGVMMLTGAAFNAIGKPLKAAQLTIFRAPILLIVCCSIGGALYGLTGLFVGMITADILVGLTAWWWTRTLRASLAADAAALSKVSS